MAVREAGNMLSAAKRRGQRAAAVAEQLDGEVRAVRAATTGSPPPSAAANERATTATPAGGARANRRGETSQAAKVEYACPDTTARPPPSGLTSSGAAVNSHSQSDANSPSVQSTRDRPETADEFVGRQASHGPPMAPEQLPRSRVSRSVGCAGDLPSALTEWGF